MLRKTSLLFSNLCLYTLCFRVKLFSIWNCLTFLKFSILYHIRIFLVMDLNHLKEIHMSYVNALATRSLNRNYEGSNFRDSIDEYHESLPANSFQLNSHQFWHYHDISFEIFVSWDGRNQKENEGHYSYIC